MAGKWMRWNETSHIFEYSTNDGVSYIPLPLNASILNEGTVPPAQLPATSGSEIILTDGSPGKLHLLAQGNTSSLLRNLKLVSGSWIQDDPSQSGAMVHLPAAGGMFYYQSPPGGTIVSPFNVSGAGALSCAGITCTTVTASAGMSCTTLTTTGQTNLGNTLITGNMQNTGYVYPGRVDTPGAAQGSWILAGHGSYGIYCNTGFYVVGNVWCAGLINSGTLSCAGLTCSTITASGAISCTNIVPSGLIYGNGIGSAAASVSITLAADGYIRRISSSERFKEDIRRGWTNPQRAALLGISPILYTAKEDTEKKFGDYLGFSAEELDAAGLRHLVNYEEDKKTPASIREHAFLASFLDLLKDHERRIVALE
jgi:hypothetical protein